MITSDTPYKLAEICRMTWPQLYRHEQITYNTIITQQKNDRRNDWGNAGATSNRS